MYGCAHFHESIDVSWQLGQTAMIFMKTDEIHQFDRIALVGKNGSGKSSLLSLLKNKEEYEVRVTRSINEATQFLTTPIEERYKKIEKAICDANNYECDATTDLTNDHVLKTFCPRFFVHV